MSEEHMRRAVQELLEEPRSRTEIALERRALLGQAVRSAGCAVSAVSLSAEEVRIRLREACAAAGSQQAFAALAGVSAAFVSDVLLGRRAPSDGVLIPLGLKRITSYVEVRA